MKKILAILLLTPVLAFAAPAICADTEGGGRIILTPTETSTPRTYFAFATNAGGRALVGKWTRMGDDTILVHWSNNEMSLLEISWLKVCKL